MKKLMLLFAILPIYILSFSQNVFTDSTLVMGVVNNGPDGTSLGKNTREYCMLKLDKHVDNGTVLIVSGIYHCIDKSILKEDADFYEVFYKGEKYLIKKNTIYFMDSVDYFSKIKSLSAQQYNNFKEKNSTIAKLFHEDKILEIYNKIKTFKGLSIIHWNIFDVSEYTDGTGVRFEIYNPTKKTIKYIQFNVVGKNPVGDIVYTKGKSIATVKGVGPIKPGESGVYSFDYVWFTDLVNTAKISTIVVTYMDNTTITIKQSKSIQLPYNDYLYLK